MPIYEYACPACGHQFEELARSADADRMKCPKCQTKAERKLSVFSAAVASQRGSDSAPSNCPTCPAGANGSCPYSGMD